jgi:hypothetical protein
MDHDDDAVMVSVTTVMKLLSGTGKDEVEFVQRQQTGVLRPAMHKKRTMKGSS